MNMSMSRTIHHAESNQPRHFFSSWLIGAALILLAIQGCTAVNTFPMTARAGDTVSVMVGGSEKARKEIISATLTDSTGRTWDLQALGLIRSVFNLRMDGRAVGLHYSSSLDSDISWIIGHEPTQTVMVADLPTDASPGAATLTIALNVNDNSSGIADPFTVNLDIVPGVGNSDTFLRQDYQDATTPRAAQLGKLEPAPHAKISFSNALIGAASLKIAFNNATLNGNDINVYVPEATVRSSASAPFGATQRMVYWRQDGQNLYIDIVAPQGIAGKYLQVYVIHPKTPGIQPDFIMTDVAAYDTNGQAISAQPALQYFP